MSNETYDADDIRRQTLREIAKRWPELTHDYNVSLNKPQILSNWYHSTARPFLSDDYQALHMQRFIAVNEYTPKKILNLMVSSKDRAVRQNLVLNPNISQASVRKILRQEIATKWVDKNITAGFIHNALMNPKLGKETANLIMKSGASYRPDFIANKAGMDETIILNLIENNKDFFELMIAVAQNDDSSSALLETVYHVYDNNRNDFPILLTLMADHVNMNPELVIEYLRNVEDLTEHQRVLLLKKLQKVHGLFPGYPEEWLANIPV